MNRETRTRWYNHKCSKCSAHPFVIIIRIVLYALVRYLRPTLYIADHQKKDLYYAPLTSEDDHSGRIYLAKATKIFQEWKISGLAGLTTETFTACIQTMGALPELADYLIQQHGFHYVLTGKLMSDPIEGWFGWYR